MRHTRILSPHYLHVWFKEEETRFENTFRIHLDRSFAALVQLLKLLAVPIHLFPSFFLFFRVTTFFFRPLNCTIALNENLFCPCLRLRFIGRIFLIQNYIFFYLTLLCVGCSRTTGRMLHAEQIMRRIELEDFVTSFGFFHDNEWTLCWWLRTRTRIRYLFDITTRRSWSFCSD